MVTTDPLRIALDYLKLLESDARAPQLEALFAPDMLHREFPSKLNPRGRTLTRDQLRETAQGAPAVIADQRYSVRKAIVQGDDVALEVDWSATLRVPLGTSAAGQTIRAAFGMFLTFRDGLIVSQRNYDCFEPF